jgi:hypothetical protein
MASMTSMDHCYCGAHDTRAGASSAHSSDGLSDISGSLLLLPIVAMSDMTSDDYCYCWPRGTSRIAIGAQRHAV